MIVKVFYTYSLCSLILMIRSYCIFDLAIFCPICCLTLYDGDFHRI